RYLYPYKEVDDICKSWSKPDSVVDAFLKKGGHRVKHSWYFVCRDKAVKFSRSVPFFKSYHHRDLVKHPAQTMETLNSWLGLKPFGYDVSLVSDGGNIKNSMPR